MSKFIAFEGIDGSGKSTQFFMFAEYLFKKDKHNNILLTRNPYKNQDIRNIIKEETNPLAKSEKLADLFIADRFNQANEIIIPNLKKEINVITDRFKLSTIAYQSAQGIDMHKLIEKQKNLPVPDFTFIVDLPAEVAEQRMKQDAIDRHRFETNLKFLEDVRQNFLKAAKILKNEKIFVINGNQPPEKVFEDVKSIFEAPQ